jgi:hypothetical protein
MFTTYSSKTPSFLSTRSDTCATVHLFLAPSYNSSHTVSHVFKNLFTLTMSTLTHLNSDIRNILCTDNEGYAHGHVCLICDKFLSLGEQCKVSLKIFLKKAAYFEGDASLPAALRNCYKFSAGNNNIQPAQLELLHKCLLSPRSFLVGDRRYPLIMCCENCQNGLNLRLLQAGKLPCNAIANHLTIGTAPPCLNCLNDIELALLSQARFHGHLFTYWAGCHQSIKGWHTLYNVNPSHTTSVLHQVSTLTESDNIAVVLCGPFTPAQREQVLKKTIVNISRVQEAFQWLQTNNHLYADLPDINLAAPKVIDGSRLIASQNSDIESREEIRVIFPDGTISTGGCVNGPEFDRTIAEIRSKCGEATPFLSSRPSQRILRDFADHNLMRAFPKQFPYGYGYNERFSIRSAQNGFLKHLLSLSIPAFHEAQFVCAVHNMFECSRALTGTIWQVMGGHEQCNVTEEQLNLAIARRFQGLPPLEGATGTKFLDSVQAVHKQLAHSNAAAKAARPKFISLIHHFGSPALLFTVSFDDTLDLRIAAFAGHHHNLPWFRSLQDFPPEEAAMELQNLNDIRYKYPGLCALNFEYLLEIILDKLVGVNETRTGIFGTLAAYGLAVEEQGRKTLHTHIIIYLEHWNKLMRLLQSPQRHLQLQAETQITSLVDSVLSTALLPSAAPILTCPACCKGQLTYAEGQPLRDLRHKIGSQQGIFSKCPACHHTFQADELAAKRTLPTELWTLPDHLKKAKLAIQVLSDTTRPPEDTLPDHNIGILNYKYNHHLQQHANSCFKETIECRFLLPDMPEPRTRLLYSPDKYELFSWTGEVVLQHNITIRPQRFPQDAFTNSYSKHISSCLAPSNSNISFLAGPKAALYTSNYVTKPTQKEDTKEYSFLASFVANRFLQRRKDNPFFESMSRLMGAVMVSTSEHVCAAPMAAYLVRNTSRFKFSVPWQYVPLREAIKLVLHDNDPTFIKMSIRPHRKGCFLSSLALHYIQRPKIHDLESLCMLDFFQNYELLDAGIRTRNDQSTTPSTLQLDPADSGYNKFVLRKRDKGVKGQFNQWSFPDASTFGENIFHVNCYPAANTIETYCCAALVLFHPFRSLQDVTIQGSFHKKFLHLFPHPQSLPQRMHKMLFNIQLFYNGMKLPAKEDPLTFHTVPFSSPEVPSPSKATIPESGPSTLDHILDLFAAAYPEPPSNSSSSQDPDIPNISLHALRAQGARRCGFSHLPTMHTTETFAMNQATIDDRLNRNIPLPFISTCTAPAAGLKRSSPGHVPLPTERDKPHLTTLMQLTYRSTKRIIASTSSDTRSSQTPTIEATGTILSILQWSQQPHLHLDIQQQLAFQTATAALILTYYDDARGIDPSIYIGPSGETRRRLMRSDYAAEKKKLRQQAYLMHRTTSNLLMFLDGAAGSGKSHVVSQVLAYGKAYTSKLNLTFDMRTVIVTAITGVAATSIGGETTASACFLQTAIKDRYTSWVNARLLIIDEISFMGVSTMETLDQKLRVLMQNHTALFGGLHILFCGDFRQLQPFFAKPLYSPAPSDRKWVNSITCYIELLGTHRFKEDPEWGALLGRLRNGLHTLADIATINTRVVSAPVPDNITYCTYTNADRAAVNNGIFYNVLHKHYDTFTNQPLSPHILAIRADNITHAPYHQPPIPFKDSENNYLYQNCPDHRVKVKSSFNNSGHLVDPLLKLYYHVPLMLVSNEDVPNGHANGTRVLLEGVVLAHNSPTHNPETITFDGLPCLVFNATDVDHLICSTEENPTKLFLVRPKRFLCTVNTQYVAPFTSATIQVHLTVNMTQFPVLVNNATTGHKLQGQSKDSLFICVWSSVKNWNYVALSRVRTRAGLYLMSPLPLSTKAFDISPDLRDMYITLRTKHPPLAPLFNIEDELSHLALRQQHYLPPDPPTTPAPAAAPPTMPATPGLDQLSELELVQIQEHFTDPVPATDPNILFHIDSIPITNLTFNRLLPQQWLNDEIINSFRHLLLQRDEARSATLNQPRSYIYSTYFLPKLLHHGNYSFQHVHRWHHRVPGGDLFHLERILMPINQGNNHWACMEILPRCRCIIFHDSLRSSGLEFRDQIYQYLKDIYRDLHPNSRLVWAGQWSYLQGNPRGTPQQHNGYDCGVFTCAFMDCLMRGQPLEFTQQQLEGYRLHIAISLLHQQAPPWDQPFLNNPYPDPPIPTPHNNFSPPLTTQPHIFQDHDTLAYT